MFQKYIYKVFALYGIKAIEPVEPFVVAPPAFSLQEGVNRPVAIA